MSDTLKEEKEKIEKAVMAIFESPLTGPILSSWGMKDSGELNSLLKQLLGSLPLLKATPDE